VDVPQADIQPEAIKETVNIHTPERGKAQLQTSHFILQKSAICPIPTDKMHLVPSITEEFSTYIKPLFILID
jgi:hypothetical protein